MNIHINTIPCQCKTTKTQLVQDTNLPLLSWHFRVPGSLYSTWKKTQIVLLHMNKIHGESLFMNGIHLQQNIFKHQHPHVHTYTHEHTITHSRDGVSFRLATLSQTSVTFWGISFCSHICTFSTWKRNLFFCTYNLPDETVVYIDTEIKSILAYDMLCYVM